MINNKIHKQASIGLIPTDWEVKWLGDIGSFTKGKDILKEQVLKSGLPANLFFGTDIPAAILIFNKGKNKNKNKDVLFIDSSKEFESGKNQNKLIEKDIQHIVSTFKSFKNSKPLNTEKGAIFEDKYAFRATINNIIENDYNLNIPRYVDTFVEEEEVDIKATHATIVALKKQLTEMEKKIEKYLKEFN